MTFNVIPTMLGALFAVSATISVAQPRTTNPEIVPSHAVAAAAAPARGGPAAAGTQVKTLVADMDNGSTIYDHACSDCHGEMGQGGHGGGPALNGSKLSLSQLQLIINGGHNAMPAFAVLSEQELLDISTYVATQLTN